MSYAEAMSRFGIDRPDLRNPLELVEVSDLLRDTDFKVFSGPPTIPKAASPRCACRAVAPR